MEMQPMVGKDQYITAIHPTSQLVLIVIPFPQALKLLKQTLVFRCC